MRTIIQLDTLNFPIQEMVTFARETEQCSIFSLYEFLNLSTKTEGSIYYPLSIIHYTAKNLNKIFFNMGKNRNIQRLELGLTW